ncbi:MAG: hypothetical protein OXE17_16260 [Chloroflexi bacterium]|nr:hypothetical protein [Chloroflexota bacterium]
MRPEPLEPWLRSMTMPSVGEVEDALLPVLATIRDISVVLLLDIENGTA